MAKAEKDQTETVLITPAIATKWLENSKFNNRPISDQNVDKIARDIKHGKWIFDGDTIKFDIEGNVIDGQHRLWAILKADKSVKSVVVRGLQKNAVDVIDTNKSRNNANILHFRGHTNASLLSGACRLSIGYRAHKGDMHGWVNGMAKKKLSSSEILKECENEEITAAVSAIMPLSFTKKLLGGGMAAFCYFLLSKQDKASAENFFNLLEKGTDLQEGSPMLTLRNFLSIRENKFGCNGNQAASYTLAIVIKAWNAFRNKKKIQRLKWNSELETFPKPV